MPREYDQSRRYPERDPVIYDERRDSNSYVRGSYPDERRGPVDPYIHRDDRTWNQGGNGDRDRRPADVDRSMRDPVDNVRRDLGRGSGNMDGWRENRRDGGDFNGMSRNPPPSRI